MTERLQETSTACAEGTGKPGNAPLPCCSSPARHQEARVTPGHKPKADRRLRAARLGRRRLRKLYLKTAGRKGARLALHGGARAVAKAACQEAIKLGASRCGGLVAQTLSKGPGPAAVAGALVQLGIDAYRRQLSLWRTVTVVGQAGASMWATGWGAGLGAMVTPVAEPVLGIGFGIAAWTAVGRLAAWKAPRG